jgi:hypothetical protein
MHYKVSNSELRKFKRCRRSWWLTYYRGLRYRKDGVGAFSVGNMVHHPLEMFYSTPDRDPATFDWERHLDEHAQSRLNDERFPEHLAGGMQADLELARIMLRGYFEWLQEDGADSELEILAAEEEVEAYLGQVLGHDVSLIGKLDVQARLRTTGDRVFVDHKTVQNLTDLPKVGELDEQQRTYGLLQRMREAARRGPVCGQPTVLGPCTVPEGVPHEMCQRLPLAVAAGGVWNMLRKVKRTSTAKPPFYGRAGVKHNEEVYRNMHSRVWGEVRDILAVREALDAGYDHQSVAYPNPTRDCSWDCPFFAVCARFDDGSDVEDVLSTEYEVHDPYERYAEIEKG